MNRTERIYKLHALFKQGRPSPFARLQKELETSPATLKRDIAYMRDFMRAPIIYHRDANGYHYDPEAPEFELPGLWFNETELFALLSVEQLLETVQPGLLAPAIGPLRTRIRQLLKQSGHTVHTVTKRILLQPIATRTLNKERFGTVAGAVLEGKKLHIHYHGREKDQPSQRTTNPHRLVRHRDNWYLAAWCEQAQALRIFSLDCIRRAEPLDQQVTPVDPTALNRFLGASFGIFSGSAKAWAVLRFGPDASRWVADETWHPDQIGHWIGDQYELQVPYSDPRELLMDILKYGPEVEVMAPEELRENVAERLRQGAELYHETERSS